MTTSLALQNASEHWLTTMSCSVCKNTPNSSPLYKCNLGHLVCMMCYTKIIHRGVPRCTECNEVNFQPVHVSPEFLKKLKTKPGIGRPRRFCTIPSSNITNTISTPPITKSDSKSNKNQTVTLEDLFGLKRDQLRFLFDENVKSQLDNNVRDFGDSSPSTEEKIWQIKNRNKILKFNENNQTVSRKPIVCPHGPCGKIIAQSSFDIHFKYEHNDIPIFDLDRGKELQIIHDPSVISHGSSYCLALLNIYENKMNKSNVSLTNLSSKTISQKIPLCTLWLIVSASMEERKNRAYVIYWIMSNNDDIYQCTIEMSSQDENIVCSSFCGTTGLHESLLLDDVAQRMKCLYLPYGSLNHLLEEGPKLNLRIALH